MDKIPLSLEPAPEHEYPDAGETKPVMGWAAVGFGVLGIFTKGYLFVPLALVCSVLALFMRQGVWAFVGLLLTVVGLLTSPVLLALLGLGWAAAYFGLSG